MSGQFYRQPPVRDALTASLEMPQDAMRARTWKERVPDNVLRSTESAMLKALREIQKYRRAAS